MRQDHQHHRRTGRLLAVYAFGAHYHSGQASRGYRLSCRAQKLLQRLHPDHDWLEHIERLIDRDQDLQPHNQTPAVRMYFELAKRHGAAV